MSRREWDAPRSLARMDRDRVRSVNKRLVDAAEAAVEYAAWRQQTELEVEIRWGVAFDPDNPRSFPSIEELNAIDAERERVQAEDDEWLRFLDDTGLIE